MLRIVTRQATTLGRVGVTIVAVEKQEVSLILTFAL
jgi:hypothetical protein